MLILAKAAMALMLGFVCAIICGAILIPFLKKFHIGQSVSDTISERHKLKEGTPTMGGIIFIIPVILGLLYLFITKSISSSYNLAILLFVFIFRSINPFASKKTLVFLISESRSLKNMKTRKKTRPS